MCVCVYSMLCSVRCLSLLPSTLCWHGGCREVGRLVQFFCRHTVYLDWHSLSAKRESLPLCQVSSWLTSAPSVPMTFDTCVYIRECVLKLMHLKCLNCRNTVCATKCLTDHHYFNQIFCSVYHGFYKPVWMRWATCRKPLHLTTDCICKLPST